MDQAGSRAWTLAVSSDDGFRLTVWTPGSSSRGRFGRPGRPLKAWTAEYDLPRAIETGPLLPVDFPAHGDLFPIELVYYERGGGAILHLSAAPGARQDFDTGTFRVLEVGGPRPSLHAKR